MLRELGRSAEFASNRYRAGRVDDLKRQRGSDHYAGLAGDAACEHGNATSGHSNATEYSSDTDTWFAFAKFNAKHDNSKHDTLDDSWKSNPWEQHATLDDKS